MARPVLAAAFWLCFLFPAYVSAESRQPSWAELKPQQREVLAPLAQNWNDIESARKKKWLGIAARYAKMTPVEQQRVQSQMRDWNSLTPEQRKQARERYKKIEKLPTDKRQEIKQKWSEYEQLPEDQRRSLKQSVPGVAPAPASIQP